MKETGLMFKAPLVRAILEGRKTQTRRQVTVPRTRDSFVMLDHGNGFWPYQSDDGESALCNDGNEHPYASPFGMPGDRVYVRETWAEIPRHQPQTDEDLPMRKDGRILVYQADPEWDGSRNFLCADGCMRWAKPDRWRPSIHMPKEFARIWLEITGVRVERLQQITDTDCWAEGAITEARPDQFSVHSVIATDGKAYLSPRGAFSSLWESTGGDWAANPWVWVIDFKTIRTTGRPA